MTIAIEIASKMTPGPDRRGAADGPRVEADEIAKRRRQSMIKIAITAAAYDAICATLSLGNVAYEVETSERGERLIWLEDAMADRLGAMRGSGESYSDVILRLGRHSPKDRVLASS